MTNFHNKKVNKKWGHESLIYENDDVALWHLVIKQGECTSLHSHNKKKTGLCVIKGGVKVDFLTSSEKLFPSEKLMIRAQVFHRSWAMVGDVEILEIETPINKTDLIRIDDKYGRTGQPYENESNYEPYNPIQFPSYTNTKFKLGDCSAVLQNITEEYKNTNIRDNLTYIILKGQIKSGDCPVVAGGDILYGKSLNIMMNKFLPDSEILSLTLNYPL